MTRVMHYIHNTTLQIEKLLQVSQWQTEAQDLKELLETAQVCFYVRNQNNIREMAMSIV